MFITNLQRADTLRKLRTIRFYNGSQMRGIRFQLPWQIMAINGFKATGIDFYAENIDNADEIEVEDDSSDEENEDNKAYEKLLDIVADTHLSDVEDDE